MKFKEYLKNGKVDEGKDFEGDGWSCSTTFDESVWITVNMQQIRSEGDRLSYTAVSNMLKKENVPEENKDRFWDEYDKSYPRDEMRKKNEILEEEVKRIVETAYTLLKAKATEAATWFTHRQREMTLNMIQKYKKANKNETKKISKRK
jgi:hypothetical protein